MKILRVKNIKLLYDQGHSVELLLISLHGIFFGFRRLNMNGSSSMTTILSFEDHFVPSGFRNVFPGHTIFVAFKFNIEPF